MKKFKKILFLALMIATLSCLFCQPAFAISEEEVQAQVDAVGKETVSGNVLIWFMGKGKTAGEGGTLAVFWPERALGL